jgi:hypothetical protein
MNTNTKKCFTKGHEYPVEKQLNIGCPICFAEYLDKGGTLD